MLLHNPERDGIRPSPFVTVGFQGRAVNRRGAALAEDRRGERPRKRRRVRRQVGTRKALR